jgi:acetyl-CoA C-acetyltransferase
MSQRIAIVHGEQTRHEPKKEDRNYAELLFEPVQQLLNRTGLGHGDIETIITCSSDFMDGRTISSMAIQDVCGTPGKSESKVSADATFAMVYAWMRLLSGDYDTCLVAAHAKTSEGDQNLIENAAFDPLYLRPLGLTDLPVCALQATQLLEQKKYSRKCFAEAAAHDLQNAVKNPNAHRKGNYTTEEILQSPVLSHPITELERAPYSDGAACLFLATESWLRKRQWKNSVTWLDSVGYASNSHYIGEQPLTENRALRSAAKEAYKRSGISDPVESIDAIELSAPFSHQTPLWLEELGLLSHKNHTRLNASGGLQGARPGFASGLVRILEISNQLKAAPDQTGLAHGTHGALGQAHCVWILKSGAVS